MKKRYWVASGLGLAGAAVAYKLMRRPHDVEWVDHAPELHHAEHSRFILIDGVWVHYQEAGSPDAPTILLIHGFTASNFVWNEVFLPLAESGFRVIAPDLVGFGFSGKPKENEYTIDSQARTIIGLMDELKIEHATLVGSSYGGAVAATCALDYADRVDRLVLVDAVINDHARNRPLLRLAASPLLGNFLTPLMLGSRKLVYSQLRGGYAPDNRHLFDENRIIAHHRPLVAADTHRAALATLRRWRAGRIEHDAPLIRQPTLLIWGEDDPVIPMSHAQALFDLIPNAELAVFGCCGHMPMEERPEEFVRVLVRFTQEKAMEVLNH